MAPLPPYPDVVYVGEGLYRRAYTRRRSELILHFAPGTTDAEMIPVFSEPGVLGFESGLALSGMYAAGRRWITLSGRDLGLRRFARELVVAHSDVLLMATPPYEPHDGDRAEATTPLPDTFVCRIDPAREAPAIEALTARGLTHRPGISALLGDGIHLFRLTTPTDDGFTVIERVRDVSGVHLMEHDWVQLASYHAFPANDPADAAWPYQKNLVTLGMMDAWRALGGAEGAPIAIIDSGFDTRNTLADGPGAWDVHPDLSVSEFPVHLSVPKLWDADDPLASTDVGPSVAPHGTQVAGIAGALVDNEPGVGVAGVAGDCKLALIEAGDNPSSAQLAVAVRWAVGLAAPGAPGQAPLRVVNISATATETMPLVAAIDAAVGAEMVICAAAGNVPDSFGARGVGFPARHRGVLGVGACDAFGRRKTPWSKGDWQSRYEDGLDVVAPGLYLWTTDDRDPGTGFNLDGGNVNIYGDFKSAGDAAGAYYAWFGGTSGATPQVSGIASLVLAQDPGLSGAQVRRIIMESANRDLGNDEYTRTHPDFVGGPPWSRELGCGIVSGAEAIGRSTEISALTDLAPAPDEDPCNLPAQIIIDGHLGHGTGPTAWRIYTNLTLTSWVEVDEGDILKVDPIAGGAIRDRVYVRVGAPLRRVAASDLEASADIISAS